MRGQITPTTDTSNPVYYLFQSFGNTSFYMRPDGTGKVSTSNILTDDMKWYFLDSGDGYYYICDKDGNYMYFSSPNYVGTNANQRIWIELHNTCSSSDDNYKFSIADYSGGGSNIIPKGTTNNSSLNKQGRNAGTGNVQVGSGVADACSRWNIISLNDYAWTLRPDCFRPSDSSNTYFYQIKSKVNASYYIKPGTTYVETSNTVDDDMIWYFEEASSDDFMTYYYIRLANDGQYLRYISTSVGQDNAIELASHTGSETGDAEDRFQFIVVRGAVSNEEWNTTDISYNIVPKLLKRTDDNINFHCVSSNKGLGKPLKTRNDRASTDNKWTFVLNEDYVAPPVIVYNTTTNKVEMSTSTTGTVTIQYTVGDGDPDTAYPDGGLTVGADDTYDLQYGPVYTIKATATKGSNTSTLVSKEVDLGLIAPTITVDPSDNTKVTIATTQTGVTIYYTLDGNDPTTASAHFTNSEEITLTEERLYTIKARAIMTINETEYQSDVTTLLVDNAPPEVGYSGIYYIQSGNNGSYYMCPKDTYVTTKKEQGEESVWELRKFGPYYYIIHYSDGKYMVADPSVDTNTITLQDNASSNENALFEVTLDESSEGELDVYNMKFLIKPKNVDPLADHKYLNTREGDNGSHTIGLWTHTIWKLAKVPAQPVITVDDISVTITSVLGNVYYTTNGDTPSKSGAEVNTTSFTLEYGPSYSIKAISVYTNKNSEDMTSSTATKTVNVDLELPELYLSGNTLFISNNQSSLHPDLVAFKYTITESNEGGDPAEPATPTVDDDGNGIEYNTSTGISLNDGKSYRIKAIAYNPNNNTYYTSPVTQLVNLSTVTTITSLSDINQTSGRYKLASNFTATGSPSVGTTAENAFKGSIEGYVDDATGEITPITLSSPLFNYVEDATIKNIVVKGTISGSGNVGAIAGNALGSTRIYNCGFLGTITENKNETTGEITYSYSSTISGSGYVGSIVGLLDGTSRVINCYSFAKITNGTTVAGIVGYNNQTSTMNNIKTIVVNCMFYGDITGGSPKYPVYGGNTIANDGATAINNYNYFRENATFDDNYSGVANYNRSWPAEENNLTRFEYYRSILNSNRKLCTWWVNGRNNTVPTDADISAVGIAKWVLDPSIAPYPILKKWGKYPSVINQDKEYVWNPKTQQMVRRESAEPYQGKKLGTITVTVNAGAKYTGTVETKSKVLPSVIVMDMDTLNHDYGYAKIQLPYYNEVFGDPEADAATEWDKRYGGNYKDYVVTGWKITSVTGGEKGSFKGYAVTSVPTATSEVSAGTVTPDVTSATAWEDGFNFADRKCTNKDLYSKSGRVFAQGGFYYVPEGVTEIEIEAYWGTAFYLHGKEHALDRVNVTNSKNYGTKFSPAGTLPTQITYNDGAEKTINIYDDFNTMMTEVKKNQSCTVYDQAVVLVGNYPLHAQNDIGLGNSGKGGFTIMSADFDMDNEPDFCLPLQWRNDLTRLPIMPVRFDFLPIPELGLAMRHNTYAYAIGIFVPQGHFEITETSFMHTTQFEYMSNSANVNMNHQQPLILNGGEFEQIVCHGNSKTPPSIGHTRNIIMGGHVWMRRFTPGSHSGQYAITRHCAISVMGGEFPEFYLTGLYWTGVTTDNASDDNPHCYTNGGRFGIMAGAGMEAVKNSVYFEIDHSVIDEFYGGGINSNNPVAGDIHVTINNSIVNDIYCGGPKVGTCRAVTTNAKGTTFNRYFGGGNGGTNLYREGIQDATPNNMPGESDWRGNTYKFDNFKPITDYNTAATYNPKKGFHAEFEFEVFNQSNGLNNDAVARTYRHWAQFGVTETGNVTSILEDCTLKQNFYGGGNLATVTGTVTSTLKGTTTVAGNAFGAGFSATVPSFSVHDRTKPTFPTRDASGVCHNGKVAYLENTDGTIRKYTWCYKDPTTNIVTPAGVVIPTSGINLTGNTDDKDYTDTKPVFQYNGEWYCLTKVPLDNLGTVTGDVTLNIEGNTNILGNVFGGGDEGLVEGSTKVNIEYEE